MGYRVPDAGLTRAVFMVQKEVAERLYAKPDQGLRALSSDPELSGVEWGFVVGPGAFNPPPKVDSCRGQHVHPLGLYCCLILERHPSYADPQVMPFSSCARSFVSQAQI